MTEQGLHAKISDSELSLAIKLLKKNSSIDAVSAFLKRRQLSYSAASWEVLRDSRLRPALNSGSLTRNDIVQLLRDSEEYGRQHVFLFRLKSMTDVSALTSESLIRKRLTALGIDDLFIKPRIVEMPRGLELTDVRLESTQKGSSLVIKAVNVRRRRTLIGTEREGKREILTYEWEEDRAVYVLRVSSNGIADLRIQSYRNAVDYPTEVEEFFAKCTGIVDRLRFEDFSLARTRLQMVQNRKKLSNVVRFAENLMRSKMGGEVRMTSGNLTKNMFDSDEELDGSVESFLSMGRGKSKCDSVNCFWLKQSEGVGPFSDIHTFIGGANNEFIVVPHCERSDYEYVLEKITGFNK